MGIDIVKPDDAAVMIAAEAALNLANYSSLYEQYQLSIAKGGHGSCCERQTCYRALHEDNLVEQMYQRLHPKYYYR